MASADLSQLEAQAAQALAERIASGVATGGVVSVRASGRTRTVSLGSGWLGASGAEPVAPIYSVTKTFIATLVLRCLRDRGHPIETLASRWHPDVPGAAQFSVRQLLNHTAGVRDYGGLLAYHRAVAESPGAPWSRETFARETWGEGLAAEPGVRFAYSNPGYRLLAEIAEAESGVGLGEAIAKFVLEPAGIEHTTLATDAGDLDPVAPAQSRLLSGDGQPCDARIYHPGWVFHGLLVSRASEVVKLVDAIAEGDLLHPDDRAAMLTPFHVPLAHPRLAPGYGLGVMADARDPERCFGHDGGGPGYATVAWHYAGAGGRASIAALLASEADHAAESLAFDVASRVGIAPVPPDGAAPIET